jgi:LacI family transcriptional regulator
MVTVKDVAEKSGVSVSTVSHVINGTRFVSEDLRNKVREAMNTLEYKPNLIARSLRTKRSNVLGLILADITNPYYSEIARNIEYLGHLQDYTVMLCNSEGDPIKEEFYIRRLSETRADGIIIVSSKIQPELLKEMVGEHLPVIFIDKHGSGIQGDLIAIDEFGGGRMATEHLISLGHQRIACVNGMSINYLNQERVNGYRAAIEAAGLPMDELLVVAAGFDVVDGYRNGTALLEMKNRPTAIFATGDLIAYGVIQAAYQMGLRIPEELSVVGFDDIYLSEYFIPPLTTVKQPLYEISEAAINCFFERMENNQRTGRTIHYNVHLEVRESTGPALEKMTENQQGGD